MAANIKQRLVKPGRDFNYAEGVKVLNKSGAQIAANKIVYVTGHDGVFLTVALADNGTAASLTGRLHMTKHAIPNNGYGVVLPWKLVTGLSNATTNGAPTGTGTQLYLGAAGGWTTTPGNKRVIGTTATVGTGPATTDGSILFSGEGAFNTAP